MAVKKQPGEPREASTNGRTRFTVRISERLADYLDAAVKVGVYGSSPAEVARKFLENEVERLIREGLIKVTPPEV